MRSLFHRKSTWVRTSAMLALLAIAGCSDATVAGPNGSTARRAVAPAGTTRFGTLTWLAPLGTGVADPATFDAEAVTRVEVCAWVNSACSGAPVAVFSTVPQTGAGPLTVNAAAGRYEAAFDLLNTKFTTRKTYRIRALLGSAEVGGILVDVIRGRWALTRTDGSLAPLVAANTLPLQLHVALPLIRVNEVETSGGVPGDWVELYNAGTTPFDLSGFVFKDNDDTHAYVIPAGTYIDAGAHLVLEEADFVFGLGGNDAARLYDAKGTLVDAYSWLTAAATTYGRCPNGTGAFITMTSVTKGAANDCSAPSMVKINEVESNGGTPGDWVELYNTGTSSVNISGFVFKDNDDTHSYAIPAGTVIAPRGYYVLEEAAFGFGLGAAESARLYDLAGSLIDSYSWTAHASTTYGRCPDGTGAFITMPTTTKGAANDCGTPPVGPVVEAWPGTDDVMTVDGLNVFGSNLSGLVFEAGSAGAPDVLWGAKNGVGSIYRLIFNGSIWTPDPTNGWANGKATKYADGTGEPDTEDVTFTTGSGAGMYIVSERNNSNNGISRPSVLRYDVSGSGTTLTATNEWVLTADLPVVAANSGLEGITWIPDSYLVAQGFRDVTAGHVYNPAEYPNHGGGLFFVGLEGNGVVYVYALNHVTNGFARIASFATGFPSGVMALQFDRELGQLWATCDDTCGGLSNIYTIDVTPGSATLGQMKLRHIYARPSTMPNINNEGFAFGPQSSCVNGRKPAWWSDDSATGGHSIRQASIPCVPFPN